MLPLAFKFDDLPVLVLGAGRIGVGKAALLVEAGARVTIIAEEFLAPLPVGVAAVKQRSFRDGDLDGFHFVVSAMANDDANDRVVAEARAKRLWLNVVDDPARSNVFFMALHRQGEVTVAVTSEGAAPALAQELRTRVARLLPTNLATVASTLRTERRALHDRGESTEGRDWRPRIRELLNDNPASSEN